MPRQLKCECGTCGVCRGRKRERRRRLGASGTAQGRDWALGRYIIEEHRRVSSFEQWAKHRQSEWAAVQPSAERKRA